MDIRQFFFKYRSYTPIPIVLLIIYYSEPSQLYIMIGLSLIAAGEFIRISAVRYAGGATEQEMLELHICVYLAHIL